ncbi:ribonuclease H-like domain-containing protein [Tanacetum coccineum]
MDDEYNVLIKNDTWILVPRPPGVNIVRSMWLFQYKYHTDGTLSRYKARLVANGINQQLGIDCDETIILVVKPATIRTLVSLALSRKCSVHQLDVMNAFLNGYLFETVYMHQPPGFRDSRYSDHVCLLQLSLYGLKTLVDTESKLGPEGVLVSDPTLHRSLVDGLQYLTFTHPDLSYDLFSSASTNLIAYSNADWADCPATHRSTSCYCVYLGDNLLSWSSKRQHTLSRSSAEA